MRSCRHTVSPSSIDRERNMETQIVYHDARTHRTVSVQERTTWSPFVVDHVRNAGRGAWKCNIQIARQQKYGGFKLQWRKNFITIHQFLKTLQTAVRVENAERSGHRHWHGFTCGESSFGFTCCGTRLGHCGGHGVMDMSGQSWNNNQDHHQNLGRS